MKKTIINLLVSLLIAVCCTAQDKTNFKFGKIAPEDFVVQSPLIDSNTNAIILADIGASNFEGNNKGWFGIIFRKQKRIKILNDKGFDAANVEVMLYSDGSETEKLDNLRAYTYNLEDGKIITTKLESSSVFEEKISKRYTRKKFTFPAIKAGSIVEFSYVLRSDFIFNLQPWEFQSEYPCLWSEYEVGVPDFFNYVFLNQGYREFHIRKNTDRSEGFTIRSSGKYGESPEPYRFTTMTHDHRWVMKDIPAIKEEPFTSTINNHIEKIEFQLSQYRFPNEPIKNVMGDWGTVGEEIYKDKDFGMAIKAANTFLNDELKVILAGAKSNEEKVHKIYEFLRTNFTATRKSGVSLENGNLLKDIFKKRIGTAGEINLLFLAMLEHESIPCSPVLLSLRKHGLVHPIYPLMNRFNFVIAQVTIDTTNILLDASKPLLPFGQLSPECYNGTAWVVDAKRPYSIQLSADDYRESRMSYVLFANEDDGKYAGSFSSTLGPNESFNYRDAMAGADFAAHKKALVRDHGSDWDISAIRIDSLHDKEMPITVKYELSTKLEADIIYINPMFGEEIKTNPFKSAERSYPVEMPYTQTEMFVLDMEIPKGYKVEEIPKSVRYKLNEDEGLFEYLCVKSPQRIQLKCNIKLNKANFPMEAYNSLREFYSFIIKKQAEQIVLKKIK